MTNPAVTIVSGVPFSATFNNGTNTLSISGNYTNYFAPNTIMTVPGGGANSGYQQVISSIFTGGNTVVTVESYSTGTAYPGPATFVTGSGTVIWFTATGSFPQAATPTFSPIAGTYGSTQNVTITSATSGTTIYYTIDGSTPTTGSTLYSGPVSVAVSETLKAIAVKTGYLNSAVGSAAYVISSPSNIAVGINSISGTGYIMALVNNNTYETSTNATSKSGQTTFTGVSLTGITLAGIAILPFSGGSAYSVGTGGTIIKSTDAVNWTTVSSPSSNDLTSIIEA